MISIGTIFVVSALLSISIVKYGMRHQSLREAEAKARILLDRNMATHTYFSKILKPKLLELTAPYRSKDYFEPSWMSSTYAIREIHKYFSMLNNEGYYLKDAAINARSPENEADDSERAFIEKLGKDDSLESHSEIRMINDLPYLTVLRRGEVAEGSCLLCHDSPDGAPKELVRLYGPDRSFHRKTGEVISAISMRIPLAAAYAGSERTTLQLSVSLSLVLALLFGAQFVLFRSFLISPIGVIRDKALAIAGCKEQLGEEIPAPAGREFKELTEAFNGMSHNLRISMNLLEERVAARTLELKASNEQLERDIAARCKAENDYRTLFNKMLDGFALHEIICDTQGTPVDYTFLALNPAFESMTGLKAEDLIGKRVLEALPGTERHWIETYGKVALTGEPTFFEDYAAILKKHFAVAAFRPAPNQFACIFTDITDRKRVEAEKRDLEERLQRSEKMEALGQLAGGVAHDLNNVLGVSTIYSELLQEKIPEESPLRKFVDNIFASNQKGAAIIQDLLTLARRGVMVSEAMNINGIVSNFLRTAEYEKIQAYHPNVVFCTELAEDLLNIKGSPVHLEKTLMNLVSNAAEAIPGKGKVTIRTENCYLDTPVRGYEEVKQGDYVLLSVSDTGTGISAEDREKIFEPFYTKKAMGRSGTGLGLAIAWGTVKDHSGYIDVQTTIGQGTTFKLYFPVTRDEMIAQRQKIPIERYIGNGESVLVVDDMAEQRDVAVNLLSRLGYKVHAVSGGEEAVEYLKGHKADILLLDMIMTPGIDGLQTYQRILEINPTQKAIIVSGFSETERVKEAQKLGAGAYVKKPYVMEKIGMAIRDELERT